VIRRHAWLIVLALVALACATASIAVDGERWAGWFAHPWRVPLPDSTRAGGELWRIMLMVCAAGLAVIPVVLTRLTPRPSQGHKRRGTGPLELWTVSGLVLVALLIRATRLTESLWYDEIAAWGSYGAHGPGPILGNFFEPSNHVAHTLATWCSVSGLEHVLGFEIALRVPALLFSLGAVVAVWGMVRSVLGPRAGLIAGGLLAIWPVPVLEGAEARGYSMMICFSALATWAFPATRTQERPWRWCAYAALCALGVWSHFVTAFVPIGHTAWLAWRGVRRHEVGRAVRGGLAIALAGLVTLALYAPALPDLIDQRDMYRSSHGDEPSVLGAEGWHALLQLGGSWYLWAAWPGLFLGAIALFSVARRGTPSKMDSKAAAGDSPPLGDAIALSLLGLPIFLLTVVLAGSWMYARFALFSAPGAALLTAAGLETCWRWKRAAALAGAIVLLAASASDLAVRPARQPLRDAATYVRENRADGEAVLVIGLAHRVFDLYAADLMPRYSLRHGADLHLTLDRADPSWIVLYYPRHVTADRSALLEERGYVPAERFRGWADWDNGDVVVWKKGLRD
jgi:hypothetical protein